LLVICSFVLDFGSSKSRIWPFPEIQPTLAPAKFLVGFGGFTKNPKPSSLANEEISVPEFADTLPQR